MLKQTSKSKNLRQKLAILLSVTLMMSNVSVLSTQAEEDASNSQQEASAIEGLNEVSGGTVSGNDVAGKNARGNTDGKYILHVESDLASAAHGAFQDEQAIPAGTDNYFTVQASAKTKIEDKSNDFNGITYTRRINFGGGAEQDLNSVKFTTNHEANVKVFWAAVENKSQMAILDANGDKVQATKDETSKDKSYISNFTLDKAGTYYLGGDGKNIYIFRIEVEEVSGTNQPLTTPNINSATNLGDGKIMVEWDIVVEAESYIVTILGTNIEKNVTETNVEIDGLTIGETYTIQVVAVRGDDKSEPGSFDVLVKDIKELNWTFAGTYIYVTPEGTSAGDGSKSNPTDIYSAVKYVSPGQTIVLEGGEYHLSKTVIVERGINGTDNQMITMTGNPNNTKHPVLNFGSNCAGMVLAGDYWYFKDFDVTRSQDAQNGIQVSGNHNVLDRIDTYYNGNTGIQISSFLTSDQYDKWPAHNLILNCTSYGNSDRGYEDADGFAAKLTIGDGNVFDGCIAHHNADDGWDIFAQSQTGSIGKVVIKNSVAYSNGFLEDGTYAGNGNGFKLGGDSLPGQHTLINSVAFHNRAKGIDSNSCPDIIVENCTTFNNGSSNVAFYTNNAAATDFEVTGILSFRDNTVVLLDKDGKEYNANTIGEQLETKGSQDENKIYKANNYYWDPNIMSSKNNMDNSVSADWFESTVNPNVTRNAEGIIDLNGYLELTMNAPSDTGARMTGSSSNKIDVEEHPAVEVTKKALEQLKNVPETASDAEKKEVVAQVLKKLAATEWRNLTVTSTTELNNLKEIEEKIESLLGTNVTVDVEEGALNVKADNALLSLEPGKNGVLEVRKTQMPDLNLINSLTGKKVIGGEAMDLKLFCDGSQIALKVPVVISFELPSTVDASKPIIVLHFKDNGIVEELSYQLNGNMITVVTSSFGTFVVANIEDANQGGDDQGGDDQGGDDQGGDNQGGANQGGADQGGANQGSNDNGNTDNINNDKDDKVVSIKSETNKIKSPKTYDDSNSVPALEKGTNDGSEQVAVDSSEVAVVAATTKSDHLDFRWKIALGVLLVVCFGTVIGINVFHKAKKED